VWAEPQNPIRNGIDFRFAQDVAPSGHRRTRHPVSQRQSDILERRRSMADCRLELEDTSGEVAWSRE